MPSRRAASKRISEIIERRKNSGEAVKIDSYDFYIECPRCLTANKIQFDVEWKDLKLTCRNCRLGVNLGVRIKTMSSEIYTYGRSDIHEYVLEQS